jgi:hypothetical protein
MRRALWIVPAAIAVALTGYLLGRPASAPADPNPQIVHGYIDPQFDQQPPPIPDPIKPPQIPTATPPRSPELPISQVILYSSGVGYFQRDGQVDGDARVDLAFSVEDINDLLKSLVLQDLGGGQIRAVSYDSHDPLAKTLTSFAIDLGKNPTVGQILHQARGQKIEIVLGPGVEQGTILGVESKCLGYGKDQTPAEVLNLSCADGIRSVPLRDVQRFKFMNPAVEADVARALEVLARANDTRKKSVSLHFAGQGKRAVRVGYVVETPLWRTSYRLLADNDGKLFVQGWALVENPTSEDWKDVKMSLVSGRPISFKMDLYQPLYVPRQEIKPELNASVRPTSHNGALNVHGSGSEKPCAGPMFQQSFGATTPATACTTGSVIRDAESNGGFNFNSPDQPFAQHIGGWVQYDNAFWTESKALQSGVSAAATAKDFGNSFQYAIDHPVTIPRQKSSLLPIVNKALEGDKVSLYCPQAHAKHPLLALRLMNTTGLHLTAGPVSVFEGSGYAGDAQLPDLQPNEERLVSYALDLGTEIEPVHKVQPDYVGSLKLHKGMLTVTANIREATTYTIKNRGSHDRVLLVEHPFRADYKLVSKTEPKERARDVYRFEVKVATGKTATLEVVEERQTGRETAVADIDTDTLKHLLGCDLDNGKARKCLEGLLARHEKLAATARDGARLDRELAALVKDQDRLRANLKEMPNTAAAYKRYLEKFDAQETQIEKLQEQIRALRQQEEQQQAECASYLKGLEFETTIRKGQPEPLSRPSEPEVLREPDGWRYRGNDAPR